MCASCFLVSIFRYVLIQQRKPSDGPQAMEINRRTKTSLPDRNSGVAAALALQTGRFELLPDPENEMPLLEAALKGGAIDGGTGRRIAAEDGIPGETAVGVLRILNTIVRMGNQDFERAF